MSEFFLFLLIDQVSGKCFHKFQFERFAVIFFVKNRSDYFVEQFFFDVSGSNMITDRFHFKHKIFYYTYKTVFKQKHATNRDCNSFISILKTVTFIGYPKKMCQFIFKSG